MDNTKYSLSELKKMKGKVEDVWGLSNGQTYMTTMLTKEDTYTNGLEEMRAMVKPVSGRVGMRRGLLIGVETITDLYNYNVRKVTYQTLLLK